jgi:hypothetical protein
MSATSDGEPEVRALSDQEIESLPPTLDIVTAGRVLGIGSNQSRRLSREGEFPVPTFRVGKRNRVSKHVLLVHLGIRRPA